MKSQGIQFDLLSGHPVNGQRFERNSFIGFLSGSIKPKQCSKIPTGSSLMGVLNANL